MKNSIVFLFSLFLLACSSPVENDPNEVKLMTQEELLNEIKSLEEGLYSSLTLDLKKAEQIIAYYNDYATRFPQAKEAPSFLNKAADVAGAIERPKIKVQNYKTILEKYPEWPGCDQVKYLLAFTLDNDMNQREEAKSYYQQVIETGKDSNFVRDSKFRMLTIDSLTYDEFVNQIIGNTQTIKQAN